MRKTIITSVLASTLLLGGCAQNGLEGLGGYGGNPIGSVLGGILNGGLGTRNSGYSSSDFERAAVNACGQTASQYGQVSITDADRTSNSTVRVEGRIAQNYSQRAFTCSFRSDGQITDFRIG